MRCGICSSRAYPKIEEYKSTKGRVPNVFVWVCANVYCRHTWLPIDEEKRIDNKIEPQTTNTDREEG